MAKRTGKKGTSGGGEGERGLSQKERRRIERFYDEAVQEFQTRNFEEAVFHLKEVLDINPEDAGAWTLLASCYEELDQLGRAVYAMKMALKYDPNTPYNWYNYGLALLWIGKFSDGRKILDKYMEMDPDNINAHKVKKLLEEFSDRVDITQLTIEEELDALEDFEQGRDLILEEKYEEAIGKYKKVLSRKPNHDGSIANMGLCYLKMGRHEEALKFINKSLERDPSDPVSLLNRFVLYREMGMEEEAREDLERLCKLDFIFYRELIRVGIGLGELGEDEAALVVLKKGLKFRRDDFSLNFNLGVALANTGRVEEAIKIWSKFSDKSPVVEEAIRKGRRGLGKGRKEKFEYQYIEMERGADYSKLIEFNGYILGDEDEDFLDYEEEDVYTIAESEIGEVWIDIEEQTVNVQVDFVTLEFDYEDWAEFVEMIMDADEELGR